MSAADAPARSLTRGYLARHCEVANPDGILYGHLPNFPLSARGREQASAMGRYLSHAEIQAIYTSPLERAHETATILAQELSPVPPILVRPSLVEAEFGRYLQGTRYRDVVWRKPRWWIHMAWPGLVPGDESMGAMASRVGRAIAEGREAGGAFVCISHGDPIQAYWATSDHRPPWALHRLQCAKGGLLELQFRDGTLVDKTYRSPHDLAALAGPAPAKAEVGPVADLG
ncbi:MAG TPA: histidine phosphatase family protein [Candidatus Dormibacteraeota bacterium]